MRLKDIPIKRGVLTMDISESQSPFVVVYSQGKARITYLPEHGETKVVTHQGKVKRIKFDEGEEF
ncbi:XtrA/YqaO family protein [Ornithinibacillus sp. BX22]|uniref:XtrA/YqaO family protein n=2 Tax=Ornithinibacillus TaxID=484508 RepID=A0A923L7L3_9BACI|nr:MULTISPECIES: XtrA/YqaO family protein [Ornithinibacillus]MBC5637856.1 XtrA/YqaO family protein [Ornithinibacillus hominis]MBS3681780.1 XtrA/YqaO family protein [Ornithinibacillus massiliensis]